MNGPTTQEAVNLLIDYKENGYGILGFSSSA
jgi:hypothetical protein